MTYEEEMDLLTGANMNPTEEKMLKELFKIFFVFGCVYLRGLGICTICHCCVKIRWSHGLPKIIGIILSS